MHPIGHALVSVVVAFFVGFTLSFLLMPDPTGITPMIAGIVLTAVLSPLVYRHLRADEAQISH